VFHLCSFDFIFRTNSSAVQFAASVFLRLVCPDTILTGQPSIFSSPKRSILFALPFTGSAGISTLITSGFSESSEAENPLGLRPPSLPLWEELAFPAAAFTANTVAIPMAPFTRLRLVPVCPAFSAGVCLPRALKEGTEMSVKSL